MDPGPVLTGKIHVRQHVGLAVVDEGPELWTLSRSWSATWRSAWLALARSGWAKAWRSAAAAMLCCAFGTYDRALRINAPGSAARRR
ncbi:hypothetical protein Sa4125_47140 (plasmid) [Aureimonas sp. SA4125]|nr:hypothetical protein Sa4125_47140 [Aureimonas sp. SA4125]